MNTNKRFARKYFPLLVITALVFSALACNLAQVMEQEPQQGPPPEEEPFHDDGEPHPEEEFFHEDDEHPEDFHPEEEPFYGEDEHPEDFHPEEEPFHGEDEHPEEPHHEDAPPPEEECPPESGCGAPEEPGEREPTGDQGPDWTTDIAVVEVYPGNQPHGQFHVRIANHGPGTLTNVEVTVLCGYDSMDKNTQQIGPSDQREFTVTLGMQPGEDQPFPTGLDLDTNVFEYSVGCQVFPGFNDPDPGNNSRNTVVK